MTRAARPALAIEVMVNSRRWSARAKAGAAARRAVACAAAMLSTKGAEVGIVLTDDSAVRALNRKWRGIDAATNVLSFPSNAAAAGYLGDIVLAYETIAREARAEHKPFAHHVAHLAVHGFLHLIGYDHEREKDAVTMERAERKVLRELAIPDPYRPRTPASRAAGSRVKKPATHPAGS